MPILVTINQAEILACPYLWTPQVVIDEKRRLSGSDIAAVKVPVLPIVA